MLEDNLVARVYTSYETEGHFLAFYTVLNCYVYLLAYVYSPTSTQVRSDHCILTLKVTPSNWLNFFLQILSKDNKKTNGLRTGALWRVITAIHRVCNNLEDPVYVRNEP